MAGNGDADAGFVAASAMLLGGSSFAPAGANASVPLAATLPTDAPSAAGAADGAGAAARAKADPPGSMAVAATNPPLEPPFPAI